MNGLPKPSAKSPVISVWEDSTINQRAVPTLSEDSVVINERCGDISKSVVGRIHMRVFGYQAEVDPLHHVGRMVAKSDENGAHSGQIVTGPLSTTKTGWIYQRVIDNSSESLGLLSAGSGKAIDFRVPVFRTVQQRAYIKYRPLAARFTNTNDLVEFVDVDTLFAQDEIGKLNEFCQAIGLDYGEIDVLRDSESNRIFVLDVNKTPLGPPNGLSQSSFEDALSFYKKSFFNFVLTRQ